MRINRFEYDMPAVSIFRVDDASLELYSSFHPSLDVEDSKSRFQVALATAKSSQGCEG